MLYIPPQNVFFPEHQYELIVMFKDKESYAKYPIEKNRLEEVEKLLLIEGLFRVTAGSIINTNYMVSADFMTIVNLPKQFPKNGWVDLDKDLLADILSDKGQKLFMSMNMNVPCDVTFHRQELDVLYEEMYNKKKKYSGFGKIA